MGRRARFDCRMRNVREGGKEGDLGMERREGKEWGGGKSMLA